jgi:putative membrane protein
MKKVLLTTLCVFALLPLPVLAQTIPSMVDATNAAPGQQTGLEFVKYALSVDNFEAAAGAMAAERGQSPAIRELGKDIVTKHGSLADDLNKVVGHTSLASEATLPTAFDPPHQRMYDALSRASADSFDRTFITQQISVHKEALDYAQGYVDHGKDSNLQAHARQMVPMLKDHLATLQGLASDAGVAAR